MVTKFMGWFQTRALRGHHAIPSFDEEFLRRRIERKKEKEKGRIVQDSRRVNRCISRGINRALSSVSLANRNSR